MILTLSKLSFPGPDAKHCPWPSGQAESNASQGSPVNSHFGPIIFGETSPKLVDANAPTNLP